MPDVQFRGRLDAKDAADRSLEMSGDRLAISVDYQGEPDENVSVVLDRHARLELARNLRTMRTQARGRGESGHKLELVAACGDLVGVHATDGLVSVHLARAGNRAELATAYALIDPYDAGRLAKRLEV